VGYRGVPIPGVPFDERSGRIANAGGRVGPAEYAVGWAKRGPSGLIGTNRACSVATVAAMLADLRAGKQPVSEVDASLEATPKLLAAKGVRTVSFAQWKEIDRLEVLHGLAAGKIREKFTFVAEMLDAVAPRG